MAALILKILLTLYILQSLLKFCIHFFVDYETRKRRIEGYYSGGGRTITLFDNITLVFMVLFVGLLFASGGMEYLSFTTGLLVGMTLIQLYFHRFRDPLTPEKSPKPPVTPVKHMSYAIQANPGKAWREYLLMTVLLVWALYMLLAEGFGLFT